MSNKKNIPFAILLIIILVITIVTNSFIIVIPLSIIFGVTILLLKQLYKLYKRLDEKQKRKFLMIFALLLLIATKALCFWENIFSLITHCNVLAGFVASIGFLIGELLFVCALVGIILRKAYKMIRTGKKEKSQVIELSLFVTILALFFVLPNDINPFEKPIYMKAYRKLPGGSSNFVFYKDNTFKEVYYTLGTDINNGHYHLSNDTTIVIDDLDDIVDNQSTWPPKYAIISLENRRLYVYIRGRKIPYIITKSSLLQE